MHSPDYVNDATDRRRDELQFDRTRLQANEPVIKFPLPRKQHTLTPDTRVRPRSPPLFASSDSARFPSPGSSRHRFVRESFDGPRVTNDRPLSNKTSPRSPVARYGSRDNFDHQASPASRRYSDNNANWVRNSGSPNNARDRVFPRPDDYPLDRTRSVGGTIDFDGLRNVPVGPKRSLSGTKIPRKDHITRSPCIFISSRYLPTKLANLKWHLNRLLKGHRPEEIVIDDFGWNLIYDDSPAGQEKLRQCYEIYHERLFFDEYVLFMQCFPAGKQPHPQYDQDNQSINGFDGSSDIGPSYRRYSNLAPPDLASFEDRRATLTEPTRSQEAADAMGTPHLNDTNASMRPTSSALLQSQPRSSTEGQRAHDTTPSRFHTSLLPLRSDRDETNSLASGVTRSDGSRVKRNKCHRCQGEPAPGLSTLVRCSTCPREYHRRCHQDPAIPIDLPDDHTWSCARCIKKGRTANHTQKDDGDKSSLKPSHPGAETASQLGRPPNKDEHENLDGHAPLVCDNNDAPITEAPRSDSKSPQNEIERTVATNANPDASIINDDPAHSDADDLVARSFAAIESQSRLNARSQKSGKLKITRTKLPPPAANPLAQHPERANSPVVPGSAEPASSNTHTTNPTVNSAQASETIVRNSVADLRALAYERHQSTIESDIKKSGARENQARHFTPSKPNGSSSQPPQPPPQRRCESVSAAPPLSTRKIEKEIPESPEEIRRADLNSVKAAMNTRLLVRHPSATFEPVERPSNSDPMLDEKPPALKGPRPPSAITRCGICQKKIPPGPSGKNKLCSGCKKDKAAATVTEGAVMTGLSPLTYLSPVVPAGAPVARMVAGPANTVVIGGPVSDGIERSNPEPHRQAAPKHDSAVQAGPTSVPKSTATASCNQQTAQPVEDYVNRDTEMPTVESAKLESQDNLSNPLSYRILDDLQFTPTMQMQLREDPNMSEFKVQQLKQILLEDEFARTDMQVLADKLEIALRTRSQPSDYAPETPQSASIRYTASVQIATSDEPSSNSRLDFIKSVVGNSFERPKGSRLILVAMALGSAARRRMQAKDVMDWIATTVPGYEKGKGNWASRISAQLSQGRLTDSGGYWREDEWQEGDGGKPRSRWYQLLPSKEDEMWTWCPVLGEPLSPSARREARAQASTGNSAPDSVGSVSASLQASATTSPSIPVTSESAPHEAVSIYCASHVLGNDGERKDMDTGPVEDDAMEVDGYTADDATPSAQGQKRKHRLFKPTGQSTPAATEYSSEDDEPLSTKAKRRRREMMALDRARSQATEQRTPNVEPNEQPLARPDPATIGSAEHQRSTNDTASNVHNVSNTTASRLTSNLEALYMQDLENPTEKISELSSSPSHEDLTASLYIEWPEYRQQTSDEYDKLMEISKRPSRKEMFGKAVFHTQSILHTVFSGTNRIPYIPSPEKRSRTIMSTLAEPYPWENPNIDLTQKEYMSLDEFFDFPDNMIPIISEGQLAYRDGTRTDDGRLPRAREIFRP